MDKLFKALDELGDNLRTIKTMYDLHGDTTSRAWKTIRSWCPKTGALVEGFETSYGATLNFNDLESWIGAICKGIDNHGKILLDNPTYGRDFSSLFTQNAASSGKKTRKRMPINDPQHEMMRSVYGPNWESQVGKIAMLSGCSLMASCNQIPLHRVQPHIEKAASNILSIWNTLRTHESHDRMKTFEEQWAPLQPHARHHWLQRFPQVLSCANLAIYKLAHHSKAQSLGKAAFLTPLLNMEDLVQGDVLPRLLSIRSAIHPKLFLSADARLVDLGYWCGALAHMQISGRVSLSSDLDTGVCQYGIHFEPDAKAPTLMNPAICFHQLTAQEKMYQFLAEFLSTKIEAATLPARSSDRTTSGTAVSLLQQSLLLECGRPDCIDWPYLWRTLRESADAALGDLLKLRTDAKYWRRRMTDMRNDTSRFLCSVFGRIDTFQTASEEMGDCHNDDCMKTGDFGSEVPIPCDDINLNQADSAIAIHCTLRSILNDGLSSMQTDSWSPKKTTNGTFRYLFDLMKKDDPILRVMGFDVVFRAIAREIPDVTSQETLPFHVAQQFHDMSIIASCMKETSKHYNTVGTVGSNYIAQASKAITEWKSRERPWMLLVQSILIELGDELNAINCSVGNETVPLKHRHREFWNSIDDCMRTQSDFDIARTIMSVAPVPAAFTSTSTSVPTPTSHSPLSDWSPQYTDLAPTETKLRMSRRRKMRPSRNSAWSPESAISSTATEPPTLPCLRVWKQSDEDLLDRIESGKGQVAFTDWKAFLSHMGYNIVPKRGSGRRFQLANPDGLVLHTIVLHETHGRGRTKVPQRVARGLWVDRMEGNVQMILPGDENWPRCK